jgi:hypothetical protein
MMRRRRRSDRSGRAPLFSPGRPVVAPRDEQRRFWAIYNPKSGSWTIACVGRIDRTVGDGHISASASASPEG